MNNSGLLAPPTVVDYTDHIYESGRVQRSQFDNDCFNNLQPRCQASSYGIQEHRPSTSLDSIGASSFYKIPQNL